MSLALDPRIRRYCRSYAARSTALDSEDIAAQGVLGVLESHSGRLSHAILDARRAMARRVVSGARDRSRQARWAADRPGWIAPFDPCLLDVSCMLATLTERQSSCLWLGIGLGWSWASVGLVWGCEPNAAKMTAYRALTRLREIYAS
jgi:DNA-directed RNA polymerase specialized sigma24 family protein